MIPTTTRTLLPKFAAFITIFEFDLLPPQPLLSEFVLPAFNTVSYISKLLRSVAAVVINPYSVDKNDLKDVQLQNKDIMCDIASSVKINLVYLLTFTSLNDDDAIAVPHEDAQATLGDTNDPFTSISMFKDFADKNIAANDAY
ncbi:hypothetical protein Tco_0511201 [Tanacetum coccineum]